jgi:hypothetical protein
MRSKEVGRVILRWQKLFATICYQGSILKEFSNSHCEFWFLRAGERYDLP